MTGLAKISDSAYRLYCLYVLLHGENQYSSISAVLSMSLNCFSLFRLTKNQNVCMENYQFKHIKGYFEYGSLCSWMTFSYSCVLFSNWNWLVCSSSVLNVMCIWGWKRLSFPSKPVCGMTLQNTVSTKVFVALKFLSRPLCLDKKIAN